MIRLSLLLLAACLCMAPEAGAALTAAGSGVSAADKALHKKSAAGQSERLRLKYYELKEGMGGTAKDIERMKDILARQEQYITATTSKLSELENMRQNLVPYLKEVIARLESNVNKDFPFLREERTRALSDLSYAVADTKLGMGDKLRKVLDALKTEMDYGYTVENSMGEIQYTGEKLQVHLYRLGRVAMYMRTIDDTESAMYDGSQWVPVSKEYGQEIKKAMENAKRSKSTEFVKLPIRGAK